MHTIQNLIPVQSIRRQPMKPTPLTMDRS